MWREKSPPQKDRLILLRNGWSIEIRKSTVKPT